MSELKISGLDEVTDSLKTAISMYPDKAETSLKKMGNQLKRETVKYTKSVVKQHTGRLVKGYTVSRVKGYGTNMYVEFRNKAPHFHLVERGHEVVAPNGEKIGYVTGKKMVATTAASFDEKMEVAMSKMVDEILRGSDLK